MFWTKEILQKIDPTVNHVINDSKTPSGEPHVGSLRGVLIHDAIYKTLRNQGINAKYIFGSDDYDPVDEIPKGQDEYFKKYLGMPLCNVPAPPGSIHNDMADHFISGFFEIFDNLGVEAERYRMRDIYRSGTFNEPIDMILKNHLAIRDIYKEVSGSEKSDKWYPFQTICENCGRIGTTEVIDYDGKEVTYICHPNLVKWAEGCGYEGKMSPFNGNGKLPWKLEWVAKWQKFDITIEGAGMDHSTKGGSRDVASTIFKRLFSKTTPFNIPYGFFLVEGAKMSSSKGIGVTAKEMATFLSPEILRFLMIGTLPKRAINFSPDETYMVKLFNEFDSARHSTFSKDPIENSADLFSLSDLNLLNDYHIPSFSLIKTMTQLPHIDIFKETEVQNKRPNDPIEITRIKNRIASAQYWLEHYADEEEKFSLQMIAPADRNTFLSNAEKAFAHQFSKDLVDVNWNEKDIQQQVFNSSRTIPLPPKDSFKCVYKLFLNKVKGPQVGSLLSYLDSTFVKNRLLEVSFDIESLYEETAISAQDLLHYFTKENTNISQVIKKHYTFNGKELFEYFITDLKGIWTKRTFDTISDSDITMHLTSPQIFLLTDG